MREATPNEPWILTASGRAVRLANPRPEDVHLPDILLALSRMYRFTGHAEWTVLQHSLFCAAMCSPHLRLECLMHDFVEAYLGDVSSPLKSLLPEYKALEVKHERAIREAFCLPEPSPEDRARIKQMDWRAYEIDRELAMPNLDAGSWAMQHNLGVDYQAMPATKRERTEWRVISFLDRQKAQIVAEKGFYQLLSERSHVAVGSFLRELGR